MTDKQPKALRLADALLNDGDNCTCFAYGYHECGCGANWAERHLEKAAAELRRLHEVNAELVEALKLIVPPSGKYDGIVWIAKARAAIAKATGEQK